MGSNKVLVLGDDTRSFLAVVRSLGRRGIGIHAAPTNFLSPALRSRYIAAIQDLPPWMGDGSDWLTAIIRLLEIERYDLVIPCNETTLLPLQHHRVALSPLTRLAIPEDRVITALFDKHATRELARRVGVPVAAGRLARPEDTAEGVLAEFGAPVVLKPRRSYSLDGLAARGKVHVIEEPTRLSSLLRGIDADETIIEQFFAGRGVGVSVLASRGRVLQAFEHHRVREIDGASFYRVSAPLTPDLARACEALVAAQEYTGLAMCEFKVNPSGGWILLEVNARPWGSLPLPLALGVDFPYRWYRLLTAGEETQAVAYRAGIYGRNLAPDLRNSLIEAEMRRLGRVAKAWFMMGRLAELARFLVGREVHDVLVRDDLRPALSEMLGIGRRGGERAARLLPGAAARRRRRTQARVAAALRRTIGPPRIVFVCQGNICRSPFAEALLRARLGNIPVTVISAGMMPRPGRPTPDFGRAAALRHGIDLAAHRSVWLDGQSARSASVLIVFDEATRSAVRNRYPDLPAPLIKLGDVAQLGDIADPIDGGLEVFHRIYEQIAAAITELLPLLRSAAPEASRGGRPIGFDRKPTADNAKLS